MKQPDGIKYVWYLTKALFVAYIRMPIEDVAFFAIEHKFWVLGLLGNLVLAVLLVGLLLNVW